MTGKPIVKAKVQLQRFAGKGGWTYAPVPLLRNVKKNAFGWTKVKGFIDDYPINNYHLMPMGKGKLFLAVKAEIRKTINKREGDWVKVILYPDQEPLAIPDEFLECLRDEPKAHRMFFKLSDGEKKLYITWIYGSKKESTRADRIVQTINKLLRGLKFTDKVTK